MIPARDASLLERIPAVLIWSCILLAAIACAVALLPVGLLSLVLGQAWGRR